jgi:hypothetical protein
VATREASGLLAKNLRDAPAARVPDQAAGVARTAGRPDRQCVELGGAYSRVVGNGEIKMAGSEEHSFKPALRNACANSYAPANRRSACGGSHDNVARRITHVRKNGSARRPKADP